MKFFPATYHIFSFKQRLQFPSGKKKSPKKQAWISCTDVLLQSTKYEMAGHCLATADKPVIASMSSVHY